MNVDIHAGYGKLRLPQKLCIGGFSLPTKFFHFTHSLVNGALNQRAEWFFEFYAQFRCYNVGYQSFLQP